MRNRVYLIGPMSGIRSFNYPAFETAAEYLRDHGFEVKSPTDLDDAEVYDLAMRSKDGSVADLEEITGITHDDFVSKSIKSIFDFRPHLLVALDGWQESEGALRESYSAKVWGIPTVELSDYDEDHGFPVEANGIKVYDASPGDFYNSEGAWINHVDNPLRQRTVTGGVKDNRGKLPIDLIPYEALMGAADVLAYGALKYKPNNWRLGLKWMETWSSLQRHLWAWKEGEDLDPETGKPHLDHAMCQMLFLATYYHDPAMKQFDDRWTSSDHDEAKA